LLVCCVWGQKEQPPERLADRTTRATHRRRDAKARKETNTERNRKTKQQETRLSEGRRSNEHKNEDSKGGKTNTQKRSRQQRRKKGDPERDATRTEIRSSAACESRKDGGRGRRAYKTKGKRETGKNSKRYATGWKLLPLLHRFLRTARRLDDDQRFLLLFRRCGRNGFPRRRLCERLFLRRALLLDRGRRRGGPSVVLAAVDRQAEARHLAAVRLGHKLQDGVEGNVQMRDLRRREIKEVRV